eukprot:870900-Prymnesium_polylepis.1
MQSNKTSTTSLPKASPVAAASGKKRKQPEKEEKSAETLTLDVKLPEESLAAMNLVYVTSVNGKHMYYKTPQPEPESDDDTPVITAVKKAGE